MRFKRNAKPGKPCIPSRAELDDANRPAREAAERKRRPKKST